jgi:hypothetical protein
MRNDLGKETVRVHAILHVNQTTANVYSYHLIDMKNVNFSKTSAIG